MPSGNSHQFICLTLSVLRISTVPEIISIRVNWAAAWSSGEPGVNALLKPGIKAQTLWLVDDGYYWWDLWGLKEKTVFAEPEKGQKADVRTTDFQSYKGVSSRFTDKLTEFDRTETWTIQQQTCVEFRPDWWTSTAWIRPESLQSLHLITETRSILYVHAVSEEETGLLLSSAL